MPTEAELLALAKKAYDDFLLERQYSAVLSLTEWMHNEPPNVKSARDVNKWGKVLNTVRELANQLFLIRYYMYNQPQETKDGKTDDNKS